jgi:hypothetical protein
MVLMIANEDLIIGPISFACFVMTHSNAIQCVRARTKISIFFARVRVVIAL